MNPFVLIDSLPAMLAYLSWRLLRNLKPPSSVVVTYCKRNLPWTPFADLLYFICRVYEIRKGNLHTPRPYPLNMVAVTVKSLHRFTPGKIRRCLLRLTIFYYYFMLSTSKNLKGYIGFILPVCQSITFFLRTQYLVGNILVWISVVHS